jgi:hypothetical protein
MNSNIRIGLAASLILGAAALTPVAASAQSNAPGDLVLVNYSHCYEDPGASDCQNPAPSHHAYRGAAHEQAHPYTHRG